MKSRIARPRGRRRAAEATGFHLKRDLFVRNGVFVLRNDLHWLDSRRRRRDRIIAKTRSVLYSADLAFLCRLRCLVLLLRRCAASACAVRRLVVCRARFFAVGVLVVFFRVLSSGVNGQATLGTKKLCAYAACELEVARGNLTLCRSRAVRRARVYFHAQLRATELPAFVAFPNTSRILVL